MSFGLRTWRANGDIGFDTEWTPFNVVHSVYLTSSSSSSSYTYNPPAGRSLSFVGGTGIPDSRYGSWLVTQSGNTITWTKVGSPLYGIQLLIVVRG